MTYGPKEGVLLLLLLFFIGSEFMFSVEVRYISRLFVYINFLSAKLTQSTAYHLFVKDF